MREVEYRKAVFPINSIRVCIDQYENMDLSGRIYSKMREGPIHFGSCSELLLKTDRLFDEECFPQAFQQKRTFREQEVCRGYRGKPKETITDDFILEQSGTYGTMDILVQTRCKTGWQGVIKSRELSEVFHFQSEMELLKKIVDITGNIQRRPMWDKLPGT